MAEIQILYVSYETKFYNMYVVKIYVERNGVFDEM